MTPTIRPTLASRLRKRRRGANRSGLTSPGASSALRPCTTTPKGLRLARFEVSEPSEDGDAITHVVLAFNRQANHIEERPLEPEQVVQVIGYPHQRRVTRDGQDVILTEIYAAAVRRKTL
jgi:hypothetical protein